MKSTVGDWTQSYALFSPNVIHTMDFILWMVISLVSAFGDEKFHIHAPHKFTKFKKLVQITVPNRESWHLVPNNYNLLENFFSTDVKFYE